MTAELVGAFGLILTGAGLLYAARQLRMSRIIARSDFLLHYYELMQQYNDVHANLTGNGAWTNPQGGPKTEEEWSRVNRYMGLLEVMEVLIEEGLLEIKTMDRLYSHRILALVKNPVIYQYNLVDRSYRWTDFIKLWKRLEGESYYSAITRNEGSNQKP
jgi:hypothetical protein